MNLKEILKSFLPNDVLNFSCHLTQRIISSFNFNTASCDETQDFKMCNPGVKQDKDEKASFFC